MSASSYPPASETTGLLAPNGYQNGQRRKPSQKPAMTKLGTFEGVFLPTTLNVLSILMFLRFGFIIGQMGILGTFLLLILSYIIDILTTMSISAISTNGTVRGGGAYYMISRSLGPEFGGAIGIIFFVGQILNASLNVVGFIEPLLVNFNNIDGEVMRILPSSYLWQVIYSSILLALCTGVALVGSKLVLKTALLLFIILTFSTLSIPFSTLLVKPFHPFPPPFDYLQYSGILWKTLTENLWPHFTSGAAGSVQPPGQTETFKNLFGIFFPATAGIFAGASMSGELAAPSKSIPSGTLNGLLVSFVLYSLVIVAMGAAIPRDMLYHDIKVIQTVNVYGVIIILGEFSTALFSVIMGVVGAASILNAIADDKIIPGLSLFVTRKTDKKVRGQVLGVLATWMFAQVFLFADINQIATFITMAFLMTFLVMNLACFLLKVGSAPNFRPSFKYFSSRTAFTGGLTSIMAMYLVDGVSATFVITFLVFLVMLIHYLTPPLKFGDISQLLIYHQVRKYLLRLKLQMSVKYWRPQILLLCDDPRSSWNLIGFCNHLKKGGLYILGHVVLMDEDTSKDKRNDMPFSVDSYKEVQKQRQAWLKLRDMSKIKAFVQIALGPTLTWGVRNVYLGSGLGGMKPNITVIGFYDFVKHGIALPVVPTFDKKKSIFELPTDDCRKERKVSINQWVQIVEDLIIMQATVAVAANFKVLNLPATDPLHHHFWSRPDIPDNNRKYIDLYPIQMSSINLLEDGKSVLSTNFDTYTLILQLGAILTTVPEWKFSGHILRIVVFVEDQLESDDERGRLTDLLSSLRIDAEVKIICLDDGSLDSYNFLVKGYTVTPANKKKFDYLDKSLRGEQWWVNLCNARETLRDIDQQRATRKKHLSKIHSRHGSSMAINEKRFSPLNFSKSPTTEDAVNSESFKKNRRYTISNLHGHGLSLSFNMKSQQGQDFFGNAFESESSDSENDSEYSEASEVSDNTLDVDNNNGINRFISTATTVGPTESRYSNAREYSYGKEHEPPRSSLLQNVKNMEGHSVYGNSSDQLSVRLSRSNLRPNFLSVKIPQAQVGNDDDDNEEDEDDENKPSIRFVEDNTDGDDSKSNEEEENEENERTPTVLEKDEATTKTDDDLFTVKKPSEMKKPLKRPGMGMRTPSIITNNDEIIQQMRTPQFLAVDDEGEDIPSVNSSVLNLAALSDRSPLNINSASARLPFHTDKAKSQSSEQHKAGALTYRQLQEELKSLTFNDLPAKGQHLVLNELMKVNSPKETTNVIFSTLPAPSLGTHLDDDDSFDYANNLAIWFDDLPPILLLNSQTVTVTTAL